MNATEIQFRTAIFGGFHKKDVLNYIETMNQERGEKTERLQRELEDVEKEKSILEEASSSAARREAALNEQVEKLTENLAIRSRALEESHAEQEREGRRRAELELLLAQFREKLSRAEPAAEAYECVKDRTAGIELEAHHRAKEVEAAAEEQVKKTKAELAQWIYKVQAGYDRLRTDVEATVSHAAGELDRVRHSLETLTGEFGDHETALEELLCGFRDKALPKAPEPLSLEKD